MAFGDTVASAGPYAICTLLQADDHTNTSSLNFYRSDALSDAQRTVSMHSRQFMPAFKQMLKLRCQVVYRIVSYPTHHLWCLLCSKLLAYDSIIRI